MVDNSFFNIVKRFINSSVLPLIGLTSRERDEVIDKAVSIKFSRQEMKMWEAKNKSNANGLLSYCFWKTASAKYEVPQDDDQIYGIQLDLGPNATEEDVPLVTSCLGAFDKAYKNGMNPDMDGRYRTLFFDYLLENGISNWVVGDMDNEQVSKLLECIEHWSLMTYEGHHVCYGFLIDAADRGKKISEEERKKEQVGYFLDYLWDEYSAVVTDGISSLFVLDAQCDLVGYESVIDREDGKIPECNIQNLVLPFRFAQIIDEKVLGAKVGIFLLINGDIIIAKKQKICFIKRNGHWLNFQKTGLVKALGVFKDKLKKELIESIFMTAMDVSLSHCGGIIAVVDTKSDKWEQSHDQLLNKCDVLPMIPNPNGPGMIIAPELKDILTEMSDDLIEEKKRLLIGKETDPERIQAILNDDVINEIKKDAKKRVTKRKFISSFLYYQKSSNYIVIDRKLRCELTGLDGATILDQNGDLIAVGAIIQNDAGSSGGGRGAAAKKLSGYGGFAVKISTDGYIETYVSEAKVYSIK